MSEYTKTQLNLRQRGKSEEEKKTGRGQIMSEYTKTKLNLHLYLNMLICWTPEFKTETNFVCRFCWTAPLS